MFDVQERKLARTKITVRLKTTPKLMANDMLEGNSPSIFGSS